MRLAYGMVRDPGSSDATPLAPWEVTRVAEGGLTFWPTDSAAASTPGGGFALVPTSAAADATWFSHVPAEVDGGGEKLFTAGCGGWIGHVVADEAKDDVLLPKRCEAPPPPGNRSLHGRGELGAVRCARVRRGGDAGQLRGAGVGADPRMDLTRGSRGGSPRAWPRSWATRPSSPLPTALPTAPLTAELGAEDSTSLRNSKPTAGPLALS